MPSLDDRSLVDLLDRLAEVPTIVDTVEQAVVFAAQTFSTPYAGATLIRDRGRRFETVGPTHDDVWRADELQDELAEGPCVDAAVESRTVVSNDLVADPRWPRWGPRTAGLGMTSVLSSEIHAGGKRVGALNIYGAPGQEFSREDMEVAGVLTQHVSLALRFTQQIEGLHAALDSRTVIGQAQGVLMERYQVDADGAFAILRRFSQDRNVRLVELARAVVAQAFDPASDRPKK
jgi:GAF domain-containing protein